MRCSGELELEKNGLAAYRAEQFAEKPRFWLFKQKSPAQAGQHLCGQKAGYPDLRSPCLRHEGHVKDLYRLCSRFSLVTIVSFFKIRIGQVGWPIKRSIRAWCGAFVVREASPDFRSGLDRRASRNPLGILIHLPNRCIFRNTLAKW